MRLIDADELKGKAIADPDDGEYFVYCQDIDEAPTVDAVPVERCQKCIFYDPANCSNWCSHPKGLCNPGESDFCSYGKEPHR